MLKCGCCKRFQKRNGYDRDICGICNFALCEDCEYVGYDGGGLILNCHNREIKCILCLTFQLSVKVLIHDELLQSQSGGKQYHGRKLFCR